MFIYTKRGGNTMSLEQKKLAMQMLILLNVIVIFFSMGDIGTLFWLTVSFVILNVASFKLSEELKVKEDEDKEYIKGVRKRQRDFLQGLNEIEEE